MRKNLRSAPRLAAPWLLGLALACGEAPAGAPEGGPQPARVVGQLLLPGAVGSRGVEVLVHTGPAGAPPETTWVLFDADGRFSHAPKAPLRSVVVEAGSEVYRVEGPAIPPADASGQVELGPIDLRARLVPHRLRVRAGEGVPHDDVRVALFIGLPPVGPYGEPVSLGSRQFPDTALHSDIDWLLPRDAREIYFLVERPEGPGRGLDWRSGPQRRFGPYTVAELPAELRLD